MSEDVIGSVPSKRTCGEKTQGSGLVDRWISTKWMSSVTVWNAGYEKSEWNMETTNTSSNCDFYLIQIGGV